MKRYFTVLAIVSVAFLIMYLLVESLHISIFTDPKPLMSVGGFTAALVGIGLLIADVLLPTPSSLVMAANGTIFGIVIGALLSLVGRAGSFLFGYYIGRKSIALIRRFISTEDLAKANLALSKWGMLAIIGTRPLPILSETISIAAGISKMPVGFSLLAATIGSVPEALLFAVTGAIAGIMLNISYVFIGIIALMFLFWVINSRIKTTKAGRISDNS